MAGEEAIGDGIIALEKSLHHRETRSSAAELERLLAEDFVEFGQSGRVFGKETVMAALLSERDGPAQDCIDASDFTVRFLAVDVVLLTYRSVRRGAGEGRDRPALRSSIWKRETSGWQMVFHQGTPAFAD